MLPEAGAFELVFLAMVALIVVGPKDLPVLLRKVGQFTAKMRGLASEFRSSFDEMARQSELDDLRREVEALRDGRFGDAAKPELESHLADIHAGLNFDPPAAPAVHPVEEPPAPVAHTPEPVPSLTFGPATHADLDAEPELPLPPPVPRSTTAEPSRAESAH